MTKQEQSAIESMLELMASVMEIKAENAALKAENTLLKQLISNPKVTISGSDLPINLPIDKR